MIIEKKTVPIPRAVLRVPQEWRGMVAAKMGSRCPDATGEDAKRRRALVPAGLLARHPGPS